MVRKSVTSSNIRAIGYDDADSVLEIEFNTGAIYHYSGVPAAVHTAFMSASSHGRYFHANIKGVYAYRKVS